VLPEWYRGRQISGLIHPPPIGVSLAVELVQGRPTELISAGQAVDVALGSVDVQDVLIRNPLLGQFEPFSLALDAEAAHWLISLTDSERPEGPRTVTAVVDALQARIITVRESP
jgi:hypothetical protein